MHDYETDPRPLSLCLRDFAAAINGGKSYGARRVAAAALRIPETTLNGYFAGRPCVLEPAIRRLMTLAVRENNPACSLARHPAICANSCSAAYIQDS